jgi:hypothetical protein
MHNRTLVIKHVQLSYQTRSIDNVQWDIHGTD